MNLRILWLVCGAFLLLPTSLTLTAASMRVLGSGVDGENAIYVPALPAVLGNREKGITIEIDGVAAQPAYLRADLLQVAGKLAMPLTKDIHLLEGISFPNGSFQILRAPIKFPDVKRRTEILVRLALVPNGQQASPIHLLDLRFDVFPASVTKDLIDLLQPKPNGSASVVLFGRGQSLRHFLTDLHIAFEDDGASTPDRFDPNRLYFGELTTDEQFQQAQDQSAGARMVLFSPDESLPPGVYTERSNSGVLIHVTSPLLDDLNDDPRAQLGLTKIVHLLSAPPSSAH